MIFTNEIKKFIKDNVTNTTSKELAEMVNSKFGTDFTWKQIRYHKQNRGLKSGIDTRFKPKSEYGKDFRFRKGISNNKKDEFKPGNVPHNILPIGSEIEKPNGQIWVKVSDPSVWMPKHYIEWEIYNPPLEKNDILLFKDGNPKNCELSNLIKITRKELAVINRQRMISRNGNDPEMTEFAVNLARLMIKRHSLESDKGEKK